MRKRPLGKTGLSVSELALGTWGLSGEGYGPVPEAEQDRVIDRALALGITVFETADNYAHGMMEKKLGTRLPKEDGKVRIVTKVGTDAGHSIPRKWFKGDFIRERVAACAERLQREVLDVVLLHNPSEVALQKGEATAALNELKNEGKLRAWGVSAGSLDIAREAIGCGAQVISVAHNALHGSTIEALREDIERDDVGVLAHSVLAYGLLCGHWPPDKEFPSHDHRAERWTRDELRRRVRQLDALRPAVGGPVLTLRAAALRFALSEKLVSTAVIGPRSTVQLDQLVREAGKGPPYFSEDTLSALSARLEEVGAA